MSGLVRLEGGRYGGREGGREEGREGGRIQPQAAAYNKH